MVLHIIRDQLRLAQARHLIETGRDVNAYDKSGWTPLLKAAYHGHAEVARELIRANADVHLKIKESRSGGTVLNVVAYYIYKVLFPFIFILVNFILGTTTGVNKQAAVKGAEEDIHLKVRGSGRTSLHVASYYGHLALVKLFLETNISLNEQDDEGRTALMLAVQRGHSGVVAELVKAGADISIKDEKGMNAVLLAKSYDMVRQLVVAKCRLPVEGGLPVYRLSREDRSRILWHACDVGDLSMVRSVIEAGCDVDHIHKGQTPLMMATLRGQDSIVKELILANCDVNFGSGTLFHCMADHLNLAKVIQAKGHYLILAFVCVLLPWMQFQIDVEAALWIDPVWGCLVLLVMSVLAISGIWLMPESCTVRLLGCGMVVIAMVIAMKVAVVAGPVAWTMSVITCVAIALVMRRPKATDIVETIVFVTLSMCESLVMILLVPMILAWSPQDVMRTEVVSGGLIMVVAGIFRKVLWKKMVQVRCDIVVGLLKGVILNVELFVIAASCMMMARKTFVLHESQAAQGMVELLMAVSLLIWFLLIVLSSQAIEMTLYRGAAGFLVFEAIKLLKIENVVMSLDKLHLVMLVLVVLVVLVNIMRHVANEAVVAFLHLVMAMVEAYLALVISKAEAELWIRTSNLGEFLNVAVVLAMVYYSFRAASATSLYYAASYNSIKCGALLVEGGADILANCKSSQHLRSPLEIGSSTFQDEVKKALSFNTKKVIVVIGNSECGKSTLVAALEHVG